MTGGIGGPRAGRAGRSAAGRAGRAAALLSAVCAAVLLTGACATNTVPYDTTPPPDAAAAAPEGEPVAERSPGPVGEFEDAWADSCDSHRGEIRDTGDSTLTAYAIGGEEVETIDPSETCTEPAFGRSVREKLYMCCDGTWQPL
ncbi:hypothetical protein [Streptomyces sp. NPDC048845]|uniref:hypothetical protein n=1 Tax=Streptomyces sp. NPDC048845 TaxID=3155390 RepID=UPI00117F8520